jgi:Uma2 family endonuclease
MYYAFMPDRAEDIRMTLAEFLDWDDGTSTRYELVDGIIYAMAPPATAHGIIAGVLGRLIGNQLKPPCLVLHQAPIVLPAARDTCYEADLAISCSPHERGQQVTPDPVVIIEILSPSTARYDRSIKVADYTSIRSVQEVVLVASEVRRIVVYRRDGERWSVLNFIGQATLELTSVDCRIDLADVYAGLDV